MRTRTWFVLAGTLVLFFSPPARVLQADITTKVGFSGQVPKGQIYQCPPRNYLIGVTKQQTDRIVGMTFVCVPAGLGPVWKSLDEAFVPVDAGARIGDLKSGTGTQATCPYGFFMIGLRGTFGHYSADAHGAPPVGVDLLADIAPVCRQSGSGAIFAFNDGRLTQADDNKLKTTAWDGVAGKRSCSVGEAAIGMLSSYEKAVAGGDPKDIFNDVALICDRLPILPPTVVPGEGPRGRGPGRGNP